jgi:tetratricopeptide (TPR) repeat protein
MMIGVAAFAIATRHTIKRRWTVPKHRVGLLAAAGTLAFGAVLASLGAGRESLEELADKSTLKVSMLSWTRPLIGDYPLFGIGRGAFESAFQAYARVSGAVVFSHAENFPGQWLSEWGIPVGACALAGLMYLMRPRVLRGSNTLATATWCAAFALLLQNLFDLALEIPAVCVALTTCLGARWGATHGRGSQGPGQRDRGPKRVLAAAVASFALLILPGVWRSGMHDLDSDRLAAHALGVDYVRAPEAAKYSVVTATLHAALESHPADSYLPLMVGVSAWATHRRDAIWGAERSLERSPVNGGAHLLVAQIAMAQHGYAQARLELRHAVEDDGALLDNVAMLALQASTSEADLLETVPHTLLGVYLIQAIAERLPSPRKESLLEEASKRAPDMLAPHQRLAASYLTGMALGTRGFCGGESLGYCEERASFHVDAIERLQPAFSQGFVMHAQLLISQGRSTDAAALLARRCPEMIDRFGCMTSLANLSLSLGHLDDFDRLAGEIALAPCGTPEECSSDAFALGDLYAARGDWGHALTRYEKATDLSPAVAGWTKVAEAAAKLGLHDRAVRALERAIALSTQAGGDPDLSKKLAEERSRALDPTLDR